MTLYSSWDKVSYSWQCHDDRAQQSPHKHMIKLIKKGEAAVRNQLKQQLNPTDKRFMNVLLDGLPRLPKLTNLILQAEWEKVETNSITVPLHEVGTLFSPGHSELLTPRTSNI